MKTCLVMLALFLVACGTSEVVEIPFASAADITEEERACLDFIQSIYASREDEQVHYRRLADRIEQMGHTDAAEVLEGATAAWEGGTGEEAAETSISTSLAKVGQALGDAGHIRCTDLAEAWGIDGYDGEAEPTDLYQRQRSIWLANGVDDYFLLIGEISDDALVQHFVQVIDGEVDRVFDEDGNEDQAQALDIPLTVTDLYDFMDRTRVYASRYDLVNAVPTRIGDLVIHFDLGAFPSPIDELGGEETGWARLPTLETHGERGT